MLWANNKLEHYKENIIYVEKLCEVCQSLKCNREEEDILWNQATFEQSKLRLL